MTHLAAQHPLVAWYTVEETERDPFLFLVYLIQACRTLHPEIGDKSMRLLQEADSVPAVMQLCMTMLINDLHEFVADEYVIILDDLHTVLDVPEIRNLLDVTVRHLPPNAHLVISSRETVELPAVKRLQNSFDLLRINRQDLLFSEGEIQELFASVYDISLSSEDIQDLREQTEGWIIALQLVWKSFGEHLELADFERSELDMDRLFFYLAEEVFDRQPAAVKDFLLTTCILPTLEPSVCDLLMDSGNSAQLLAQLDKNGLFVTAVGQGQFRYHRLFQQFLQQLARNAAESNEWTVLHQRAAGYYLQKGDVQLALAHYYEANNISQFVGIILDQGDHLLRSGRGGILREWIDRVPSDVLQQYPLLLFWRGEIDRLGSRFAEARHWYTLADGAFIQKGDLLGRSRVYRGQAQVFLDTIQPNQAVPWLEKAIRVLGDSYPEETANLFRLLAENYTNSGRLQVAEEMLQIADQLVPVPERTELDVRLHLRSGRLSSAKQLTLQILKKEQPDVGLPERIPRAHREMHLLLSLIEAFMGNLEASRLNAEQGVQIGRALQSPFVEMVGNIRLGHALALQSHFALAQMHYHTAVQMCEDLQVERGKVEALMGLCITSGLAGEIDQAEQYARTGLELAIAVQDFWCANLIRLSIGSIRAIWGHYEEALPWLLDAEEGFTECADSFGITNVHLWLAYIWHKKNSHAKFKAVMQLLLQEAEQFGYQFLFYKRTLFGPIDLQMIVPCLIEARDKLGIAGADNLLRLLGCKGTARHPGYTLRVQTLGKFAVYRGLEEVARKEWKRDKSRQLFQVLLTRRGQFLQREEIFELLWPGADEKTAMRDFKVALNALINALEPGREARSDSYFIERLDNAYRLHADTAVYVDADEFINRAAAGLELKDQTSAQAQLETAVRLYQGHYLQDHPYEDWSLEERERLRTLYLQSLQRLAAIYEAKGMFEQSIKCCEQMLAIDSCWEPAYQILMNCYYAQGNRSLVTGAYKKCVFQLDEQLGVAPLEETTKLYRLLVRGVS